MKQGSWIQVHVSEWGGRVRAEVTGGTGGVQSGGFWLRDGEQVLGQVQRVARQLRRADFVGERLVDQVREAAAALRNNLHGSGLGDYLDAPLDKGPVTVYLALDQRLQGFPWELLWNREVAGAAGFPVQIARVVRDAVPDTKPDSRGALRVLLVAPEEEVLAQLLVDDVLAEHHGSVIELHTLFGEAASIPGIRMALRDHLPHVLHFVGHGGQPLDTPSFYLSPQDWITAQDLAEALPPTVQLVYLESCEGGRAVDRPEDFAPREASPRSLVSGAERLATRSDAVVGHLWKVERTEAHDLAVGFYRHLLDHPTVPDDQPPRWRKRVALALTTSREDLLQALQGPGQHAGLVAPVLFLRGQGPRARSPGRSRRVFALYAPQDWEQVEPTIRSLSRSGDQIFHPHVDDGPLGQEALEAQLGRVERVHLFWSRQAKAHWTDAGWEQALGALEEDQLVVHVIDRTRPPVSGRPVLAYRFRGRWDRKLVFGSVLGAVGTGVLAARGESWGPAAALTALGLVSTWYPRLDSSRRALLTDALLRVGDWLTGATERDVLESTELVLARAFGPPTGWRRGLWRTLARTSAVAAILALPVAVSLAVQLYRTGLPGLGLAWTCVLLIGPPMVLASVVLATVSLRVTRQLLREALQTARPPLGRLLARDLGWTAVIVAAVVLLSPATLWLLPLLTGSYTAWPTALPTHLALFATGGLRPLPLLVGGHAPELAVVTALEALLAAVPTLWYAGLLLAAAIYRRKRGRVRTVGRYLNALGNKAGPLPGWLFLAAVVGTIAATPRLDVMPVDTPRPQWATPTSCGEYPVGADVEGEVTHAPGIGHPEETQDASYPKRDAVLTHAFALTSTEITQAWWRHVWQEEATRARTWGLRERPSVYVGDQLPVETVSWCDAARFLNLWSLHDSLEPAYTDDQGQAELSGCETGGTVAGAEPGASGYRLPTADEWETATRRGLGLGEDLTWGEGDDWHPDLDAVAWHGSNSGLRPHPVATREADALGHHDLLGNLFEWVDDARGPRRELRGGSAWWRGKWVHPVPDDFFEPPAVASVFIGFRAARSGVPCNPRPR